MATTILNASPFECVQNNSMNRLIACFISLFVAHLKNFASFFRDLPILGTLFHLGWPSFFDSIGLKMEQKGFAWVRKGLKVIGNAET